MTMLPSFMTKFENMYGISTAADRETLDEVVEQLDKILFDDFVKRKAEALLEISQKGLVQSGTAWVNGPKPTGEGCGPRSAAIQSADCDCCRGSPLPSTELAHLGPCSFASERDHCWSS